MTIIVHGEVKGVGFRRYVWGLAKRLKLVGYVSNMPNNKVIIYVEGEPRAVSLFKKKILSIKAFSIEKYEIREGKCTGKYKDFIRTECLSEEG